MVAHGDIWLASLPGDKPRPVLIVSRDASIPVRNRVVVAPITSTIREIPSCLSVGREHGLSEDGVATFDNPTTIPKRLLVHPIGTLGVGARPKICAALSAVADC